MGRLHQLLGLALFGLLVIAGVAMARSTAAKVPPGPIKHFIVIMMENRAFDHMLGWMHEENPHIIGLTGNESVPWDYNKPHGRRVFVTKNAKDVRGILSQESPSPDHSVNGTSQQIFSTDAPTSHSSPTMQGFVAEARTYFKSDTVATTVMDMWPPAHVPVITTLAKNFVTFDKYHASVPGPTDVNRLYFHSATSVGEGDNYVPHIIWGYSQKSVYELVDEGGYDWGAYFGEVPDPLFFQYTRQPQFWDRLHPFDVFSDHVTAGTLPTLSFISPRYFGLDNEFANDQHPAHAVTSGEKLMKQVYELLRNSALWNESALLITYDEHGGFYDHVAPPMKGIPNPDGKVSINPPFNFERLGIRVPTILISPWVDAQVVHDPVVNKPTATSAFDHTSFIATITRMWGLPGPLTKRDAWAAPWDHLFTLRTTPRTDCPTTLPPIFQEAMDHYTALKADRPEHLQPLTDLHESLIRLGNAAAGLPVNTGLDWIKTEEQGGKYLKTIITEWIAKNRELMQRSTENK